MVFPWKALQIFIGKYQRRINQPIDHQTVITFLKVNRARVMTLKSAALRCDRAIECMDRCEIDRTDRIGSQPLHIAADNIPLIFNRQTIRRGIHTIAEALCPVLGLDN